MGTITRTGAAVGWVTGLTLGVVGAAAGGDPNLVLRRQVAQLERGLGAALGHPPATTRDLNISDIEVREIQAVAATVLPEAIVMIGPVTVGCPCGDGPGCTDQVRVTASRAAETKALMFSRINGAWELGPVQKWLLEYDTLTRQRRAYPSYSDYLNAQVALLERAPACLAFR